MGIDYVLSPTGGFYMADVGQQFKVSDDTYKVFLTTALNKPIMNQPALASWKKHI